MHPSRPPTDAAPKRAAGSSRRLPGQRPPQQPVRACPAPPTAEAPTKPCPIPPASAAPTKPCPLPPMETAPTRSRPHTHTSTIDRTRSNSLMDEALDALDAAAADLADLAALEVEAPQPQPRDHGQLHPQDGDESDTDDEFASGYVEPHELGLLMGQAVEQGMVGDGGAHGSPDALDQGVRHEAERVAENVAETIEHVAEEAEHVATVEPAIEPEEESPVTMANPQAEELSTTAVDNAIPAAIATDPVVVKPVEATAVVDVEVSTTAGSVQGSAVVQPTLATQDDVVTVQTLANPLQPHEQQTEQQTEEKPEVETGVETEVHTALSSTTQDERNDPGVAEPAGPVQTADVVNATPQPVDTTANDNDDTDDKGDPVDEEVNDTADTNCNNGSATPSIEVDTAAPGGPPPPPPPPLPAMEQPSPAAPAIMLSQIKSGITLRKATDRPSPRSQPAPPLDLGSIMQQALSKGKPLLKNRVPQDEAQRRLTISRQRAKREADEIARARAEEEAREKRVEEAERQRQLQREERRKQREAEEAAREAALREAQRAAAERKAEVEAALARGEAPPPPPPPPAAPPAAPDLSASQPSASGSALTDELKGGVALKKAPSTPPHHLQASPLRGLGDIFAQGMPTLKKVGSPDDKPGRQHQPRSLQLTVNLKSGGRRMTLDPNADKSAESSPAVQAGLGIMEEEDEDGEEMEA
eukprot:m.227038 g.227038  ORF g.227038 m.227038 type:complete len:701 (-) comp17316_c0_seq27:2185-4287(-)